MRRYYVYDLEVYPNIFNFCGKFTDSSEIFMFEISDRMNQRDELLVHLSYLRNLQVEMVGYNNLGYDYVLIHELMINPYLFDYNKAYQISQKIISAQNSGFNIKRIKLTERLIPQIDIFKVCHFDNRAKTTSLKALQFAMRSESLEDLPFDIRPLNNQEKDQLKSYNIHDVTETQKFFEKNEDLLKMRREYLESCTIQGDVLNYNDTKIGVEYFINKLGRHNCFIGGKPKQTFRECIDFSKIILPKIYFRTEAYRKLFSWFKEQNVYIKKKGQVNPKLKVNLEGLDFFFGIGGTHASAENKVFHSDEQYQIIDVDVKSMYPSIAIANRFAPEHLGETFVQVYKRVLADRKMYDKNTHQNAALKLASNGVYGNSNNPYSPFYDPQYTFSVTVNGQLQLMQLVELISLIPDTEFIQANTDGITVRVNKQYMHFFNLWTSEWETLTGLKLEHVNYRRMWIRDVNSYIAETMDGELKRKGAYWYPLSDKDYSGWWNKDFSNLASKKAAEKHMTHSWQVNTTIRLITDPFDFMLRYKATKSSKLFIGDVEQLKTVRYYVAHDGEPMKKISTPKGEIGQYKRASKLKDEYFDQIMKEIGKDAWNSRIHTKNKSKYVMTTTSVQAGWKVKQCNIASDFDWNSVDWNYYIEEANKIIIGSK